MHRPRPDNPIESVELKISFRADRETAAKIKETIPSASLRGGVCRVKIEGKGPREVAEKAKELMEKLRSLEGPRPA